MAGLIHPLPSLEFSLVLRQKPNSVHAVGAVEIPQRSTENKVFTENRLSKNIV
jgi:hypothetical protein